MLPPARAVWSHAEAAESHQPRLSGRLSRDHRAGLAVVAVCNRAFGCAGVGGHHPAQNSGGEVSGTGRVAGPAADHEAASRVATAGDLADVVSGQVGRWVDVALGGLNVALALVVLGLIAGISMPRDRLLLGAAVVIALPLVGAALANIPTIGTQLSAVAGNLQLGIAGAVASALAIYLYELTMEGVSGLTAPAK